MGRFKEIIQPTPDKSLLRLCNPAKHLQTFSRFSTVSFLHKCNGARLLSPESECKSDLTTQQTTKIRKFQENP